VTHAQTRYILDDGEPLTIIDHGQELHLLPDKAQHRPIPPIPARPRPSQPPGREPAHRLGGEQPKH
jgi:alpha,alpha-trehalose phosphorylase